MMRRTADGQIVPLTAEEIAAMMLPLATRREERAREVDALRDEKLSKFTYDFAGQDGELHLQVRDAEDRTNWLTLRGTAHDLVAAGQGEVLLPLRTLENKTMYRPASEVLSILMQLAQRAGQIMATSWALKDAVRASDDPETVQIDTGWPV